MCPNIKMFFFSASRVKFLYILLFSLQQTNHVIDEEMADGPVILRKRRAAQAEKNTCQLFIQTDHLFFRYYGTREAVIAQVSRGNLVIYGACPAAFYIVCL